MPQRELCVFISSTFADMQAERERLVKHVFPEFRVLCRAREVTFTEVDLRWGITQQEAESGGAIDICLREIDRSRPFFISILGERYGWTPKQASAAGLDADGAAGSGQGISARVAIWLRDNQSITAMEILHGVLESAEQSPLSSLYLRDRSLTETLAAGFEWADFFESEPATRHKLEQLKARIRQPGAPWRVRAAYRDLAEFENWVKEDLVSDPRPRADS